MKFNFKMLIFNKESIFSFYKIHYKDMHLLVLYTYDNAFCVSKTF